MTERLALFPLRTVLYPGLVLALHIFEERYRELVRDLVQLPEEAPKQFGVVAIRRGREAFADEVPDVYEVGCAAVVQRIGAYPDGRFDLTTAGGQRFRVRSLEQDERLYHSGEVEWLEEPVGKDAAAWAARVRELFHDYQARLVGMSRADTQVVPDDPMVLSYLAAAAMVLDLSDKQRLLAAPDTGSRLRLLAGLLRRELALIGELGALPAADFLRGGG